MDFLPLILLFACFIMGIPVGFSMLICVIPYFFIIGSTPMDIIVQRFIASTESPALLAIPFFILAGCIMNYSGITNRLMCLADLLVGHIAGGLGHVNVLLSAMMGGLSGSAAADASQQCKILVPQMIKRGYDKPFCASVTAASSLITTIIPPGIALVIYAYVTNVSVGKMFAAGYLPGILMTVGLMLLVGYFAKKRKYPPSREKRASVKEIAIGFAQSLWALGLPVLLIAGLRFGIFTATEGGAVCAVYAFVVGMFVYKELKLKHIRAIVFEALTATASVMFVICSAGVFGYYLSWERVPQIASEFLINSTGNPTIFLLISFVLFILIGMLMDTSPAMIILSPILAPAAQALGIDMVHFGMVIVMTCVIGAITPPFGIIIYLVAPMLKMRVQSFIKEMVPFILVIFFVIMLVIFIPGLATWIPNLIF